MNQLTIIGNLTKDPELRHTQDGTPVCGFTVAVNRMKTANNQDPGADYFNVSAWRKLGENCGKFLAKGSKVAVVGRVSVRTWSKEDRHGASLEVAADSVEFLSSRVSDAPTPEESYQTPPVDSASGLAVVETDELPFD